MAIVFPLNPNVLDTYSYGGRTWVWNGVSWDSQGTIQGTVGPAGPQGTQGFQGSQGFQGLQGNLGPQGIQGFQGPNAAISFGPTPPLSPLIGDRWVDSETGIEYTWINDGNNQTWVEVSASGFSGAQGIAGTPGAQGIQGPAGTMQGTQGLQGAQGFGAQGLQGIAGSAQGIQGPQGSNALITFDVVPPISPSVGDRWIDSNSGIEYTYLNDGTNQTWVETSASGFSGVQGLQGIAGSGAQGLQGIRGPGTYTISATAPVAPAIGDTWLNTNDYRLYIWDGLEWFETYGNLTGLQGTQGVQGTQGLQGTFGFQGLNGAFAAQGIQGPQGVQGIQGLSIQGNQGTQGLQGLVVGIPSGGNTGQILAKNSATSYDTIWTDTDLNQISPLLLMGA